MERIKVAHIITDLDIGGTEMMLLKTLRNFKSDKFEHIVISLLRCNGVGETIKKENFKVYSLNLSRKNFINSFIQLILILKRERPKIAHSYLFHADLLGRIAAKATHVPIAISSLRNENIGGRWREILLGMTDFCVDKVTAVSRNVAKAHILKGTTKKEKIKVIYNGLELEDNRLKEVPRIRQDMNISNDTFLLLTIASLKVKKGHVVFFDALKELKRKGYRFKSLIVGTGEEKKRLEREIANKELESEVILTGIRKDIPELLAVSDALVLPSLWEGLPSVLLEAMAAGLPVVATQVGGVSEVITDNETGLLVDAGDSKVLSEAIERIIDQPELRRHLASNARDFVIKNFDIKKTVAETERLYEELLSGHEKD